MATDSVISLAKLHRREAGRFTLSSTIGLGFTSGFACSRRPTQTNRRPESLQVGGIHGLFGILEMISAIENEFQIQLDLADLDAEQITILGPLSRYVAERGNFRAQGFSDSEEARG